MLSKKHIIYQVAGSFFRKKGYKATSMQDIAEEVGMKPASLYNHIKSKQEVLSDLLMNVANMFVKNMDAINQSSLTPPQKIEKLIGLHVQMTVNHTNEMALISNEWIHLEEPHRATYVKLRDQYEHQFRIILESCINEGYYKTVNVEIALFSILSTLRWCYSWYNRNKDISLFELENQLIQTLVGGLQKD